MTWTGEGFMDWPSTPGYVRQIARAFDLPCCMSWRDRGIQREMLRDGTPTAPDRFARFAAYEHAFGCTIRRDIDLNTLADRGRPFPAALQQPDLVRQALSPDRAGPVLTDHWRLPAGAFGESAGPG
ncbi:hypothetical protein [Komagataeibacter rhaeticus]|uniref:hypothetical protein n=1 Tax=Komagataeibacter rhaeticus TaxID=215221 RepID=UPI00296F0BBD|nr:hypothetical protein [Komagataeibacter rhaeticus]